ncbi:unnamed protein product [Pylaiella littoralis]
MHPENKLLMVWTIHTCHAMHHVRRWVAHRTHRTHSTRTLSRCCATREDREIWESAMDAEFGGFRRRRLFRKRPDPSNEGKTSSRPNGCTIGR